MHKYEKTYVPNFSLWNFLEIIECPARGLNGLIKSSYEILGTSLKKKKHEDILITFTDLGNRQDIF